MFFDISPSRPSNSSPSLKTSTPTFFNNIPLSDLEETSYINMAFVTYAFFFKFPYPRSQKPSPLSSDRRPNLAKESELPQESYISRKRIGRFCHYS